MCFQPDDWHHAYRRMKKHDKGIEFAIPDIESVDVTDKEEENERLEEIGYDVQSLEYQKEFYQYLASEKKIKYPLERLEALYKQARTKRLHFEFKELCFDAVDQNEKGTNVEQLLQLNSHAVKFQLRETFPQLEEDYAILFYNDESNCFWIRRDSLTAVPWDSKTYDENLNTNRLVLLTLFRGPSPIFDELSMAAERLNLAEIALGAKRYTLLQEWKAPVMPPVSSLGSRRPSVDSAASYSANSANSANSAAESTETVPGSETGSQLSPPPRGDL